MFYHLPRLAPSPLNASMKKGALPARNRLRLS